MTGWLRRIRGAIGMGLTWAAGWAVAGVLWALVEWILPGQAPGLAVFDAPAPALAIPGFFGGVFFSIVLGVAARRRRFHELSLARFAAWGAAGGVLLTLFPTALITLGLATPAPDLDLWRVNAMIVGPLALLSAGSAVGSLMLARMGERAQSPAVGKRAADEALTEGQAPDLQVPAKRSLRVDR